jgi:hypothetical protein
MRFYLSFGLIRIKEKVERLFYKPKAGDILAQMLDWYERPSNRLEYPHQRLRNNCLDLL